METLTATEFARLVAIQQHRVYSLEEVAEMTGISLRRIELACRGDELEHVHDGAARGMTLAQIDLLVASRTRGHTNAERGPNAEDEVRQARELSRGAVRKGRAA